MSTNFLDRNETELLTAFNALSSTRRKLFLQFMATLLELPANKTQDDIDSLVVEYQHKLLA